MPDHSNAAIAAALAELGELYELDGAIVHRVAAYRSAAQSIRNSPTSVAKLARTGRATELPGVGKTIQEKILALLDTGTIPAAEKLRARFPSGLIELNRLPGIGPKRTRLLYETLGIDSLESLERAARAHALRDVRGLGPKFEQSVLAALAAGVGGRPAARVTLPRALEVGALVIDGLQAVDPHARIQIAGSARRMVDSVKDLDIAVASSKPGLLARALAELDVIESGDRVAPAQPDERVAPTEAAGARAVSHTGLRVELRVVKPEQFGDLLQHLTGSAAHNAAVRELAVRNGLHLSEYGVLDAADGSTLAYREEAEVYGRLGLAFIEPELREDRGELEAARDGGASLPALVDVPDLRGDLHCHTIASDGRNTISEMAHAARERGYEYLAITDHSATHGFGNEVSADELRRHIERIRAADEQIEGIALLAGSEVNILPDGSLDYDDELLAELDWVLASVHTAFASDLEAMTARVVRAIEHPLVDCIGHLTGRLIGRREPYAIDVDTVIAAAARTGTLLEINSNPDRRDLSEHHARAAAAAGVGIAVNSDAHGVERLANVRWGIATARRAWLTPAQIANTRPWAQLRERAGRPRSAAQQHR